MDAETTDVPLPDGSVDCILYGDVLEHLVDPEAVLRRHRRLLSPRGEILCSVPNIQHWSALASLLRSDFQYQDTGLLDSTHLRFFTYSTFIKLLLDCGYSPDIIAPGGPVPPEFLAAATPLLRRMGLHPSRTERYLGTFQYLFRGIPYPAAEESADLYSASSPAKETPLTFVACVADEQTLTNCLLRSPCLGASSPHQVLLYRGCKSAAEGLNRGIKEAVNSIVVCLHQDVYLPAGWPRRFLQQYRMAEQFGPIGVAGCFGVTAHWQQKQRVYTGHVVDRDQVLRYGTTLPTQVDTLDELLLAVPKDTPLRFEPRVGFHFYGADICLSARAAGLSCVALDALCFHHSRTVDGALPLEFYVGAAALAQKWQDALPVATSCTVVTRKGLHPELA
jgi:hypothetical protein